MNNEILPKGEKSGDYRFGIGDHVKTDGHDAVYFGYVIDRRPHKHGGNEYNVDFYTYGQGKTWVIEWRLESAPQTGQV